MAAPAPPHPPVGAKGPPPTGLAMPILNPTEKHVRPPWLDKAIGDKRWEDSDEEWTDNMWELMSHVRHYFWNSGKVRVLVILVHEKKLNGDTLEFRGNLRPSYAHTHPAAVTACLHHLLGKVNPQPCAHCQKGLGMFLVCKSYKGARCTVCTQAEINKHKCCCATGALAGEDTGASAGEDTGRPTTAGKGVLTPDHFDSKYNAIRKNILYDPIARNHLDGFRVAVQAAYSNLGNMQREMLSLMERFALDTEHSSNEGDEDNEDSEDDGDNEGGDNNGSDNKSKAAEKNADEGDKMEEDAEDNP